MSGAASGGRAAAVPAAPGCDGQYQRDGGHLHDHAQRGVGHTPDSHQRARDIALVARQRCDCQHDVPDDEHVCNSQGEACVVGGLGGGGGGGEVGGWHTGGNRGTLGSASCCTTRCLHHVLADDGDIPPAVQYQPLAVVRTQWAMARSPVWCQDQAAPRAHSCTLGTSRSPPPSGQPAAPARPSW